MRASWTITLSAILCGLLAGCGNATAPPPAYIAAGNAICTDQLRELNRLQKPTTPDQAIAYIPRALTIMRRMTDRLAALDPPASKRAELTVALATTRGLVALLSGFVYRLRHEVVEFATFAQARARSSALRARIDQLFRTVGLSRCTE